MNNKFKILVVMFGAFLSNLSQAQTDRILSVTISPSSPVSTDSIRANIISNTSGWSIDLGYTVTRNQDSILISHCVVAHPSSVVRVYDDTFNLGILPIGVYVLKFTHYNSITVDSCSVDEPIDSAITFEVTKNTSSPGLKKPEIQVYPNPASETIHTSITQPMEVHIYDALGRKKEVAVFDKHHPIDVREWRKGIYLLYFPTLNQTQRIVIQ